jgi:hypothetical protein
MLKRSPGNHAMPTDLATLNVWISELSPCSRLMPPSPAVFGQWNSVSCCLTAPSRQFDPQSTQHDTYLLLLGRHPSALPMVFPPVLVWMLPHPMGLLPPLHQEPATTSIHLPLGQKSTLPAQSWVHVLTAVPHFPRWECRGTMVFMVPIDTMELPMMTPKSTPTPRPPRNVLLIPLPALPNTLHSRPAKFGALRHQCPH